ncbi:diguanylate cyclase domain-containing protein [Mycolicibacterium smegmatis]|uniref:Diguanylate cyclase (Ggdef) domain protein n=1 Tax=Mycolicibacterium smegmatis (strain ATCC 700084 / mc(2)155) TaxID=246196 RepID=A0QW17_MYCS2|nr:diguanylate cyclase [Mycolicibacterium smegmatis]ABK75214.1 diguanylate cyclase (ggdef) domain protein [Mycolicibacterium smegmatis MC2 155]MBE9621073.1 diguanylate cyclase [Mycolicibacterium smegmatis]MBE9627467.1 diguanylate cyclase [Mycolicibacterium smegmatis]MBE9633868.1 diguanylate cyclase [Mycolicibacterium smegmatis]MBE9646063.1 diguanylate cyclase [Mycolicibacterium smegmatis]
MSPFDHYYARTAMLSAQGQRSRMRRIIGVTITALAFVPVLMLASPAGPAGALRYVPLGATACGVLMSVWWWRRKWPSRNQSWLVVGIGTVGIAVTLSSMSDPTVGLLSSSVFSLVTTYSAFLHSRRVLVLSWIASGLTVGFLAIRVAFTSIPMALSGALVSGLVIATTSMLCRMAIRLLDAGNVQHPNEIDRLTGLLNREAFEIQAATMLGSHSRHDDQYLVILAVGIDDMSLLSDMDGTHSTLHARVAVAQALRETVRHRVPLAHVSDSEFLIADVFKTNDPSPLVERMRLAISTTPMRLTASIGTVCSPLAPLASLPAEQVLQELIDVAMRAMNESRAAGGNQTISVNYPTPTPNQE